MLVSREAMMGRSYVAELTLAALCYAHRYWGCRLDVAIFSSSTSFHSWGYWCFRRSYVYSGIFVGCRR